MDTKHSERFETDSNTQDAHDGLLILRSSEGESSSSGEEGHSRKRHRAFETEPLSSQDEDKPSKIATLLNEASRAEQEAAAEKAVKVEAPVTSEEQDINWVLRRTSSGDNSQNAVTGVSSPFKFPAAAAVPNAQFNRVPVMAPGMPAGPNMFPYGGFAPFFGVVPGLPAMANMASMQNMPGMTVQNMQNLQNMQNMHNLQNMQNMQNLQQMQNMQSMQHMQPPTGQFPSRVEQAPSNSDLRRQMPNGADMPMMFGPGSYMAMPYMPMGMYGMGQGHYPLPQGYLPPSMTQAFRQQQQQQAQPVIVTYGESPTQSSLKKEKRKSSMVKTEQRAPEAVSYRRELLPPAPTGILSKGARFRLLEEPDEMQRKSYKKENRCLHPNPLVICKRDGKGDTTKLSDGFVTVRLVDIDGRELPVARSACLESIDGGLTHPLDDDSSTVFSLKILQTSQGQLFRLQFTISYRVKGGGTLEEKIFSEPFGVYSNKLRRQQSQALQQHGQTQRPLMQIGESVGGVLGK